MHQVAELIRGEIRRLEAALAILEPVRRGRPPANPELANLVAMVAPKKRGRPPGSKNSPKHRYTAAQKKAISKRVKAYWAAKRAA